MRTAIYVLFVLSLNSDKYPMSKENPKPEWLLPYMFIASKREKGKKKQNTNLFIFDPTLSRARPAWCTMGFDFF